MQRREFLQKSAFATVGTMLIPSFLKAFEMQHLHKSRVTDKILVIIQLSGGNDGLNTLIPFENDLYYNARPKLAIEKSKVLKLNSELGFNPAMLKMQKLYDEGLLSIINSVGYPNPDRSHFRSMDIWHTASNSDEYWYTGWLGRYLDAQCDNSCKPYEAIELDDTLSLVLKGEKLKGLAMQDPQKFYRMTRAKHLERISHINHHEEDNVSYLYKTLSETISSADYVYEKAKINKTDAEYPQSNLGKRLKTISQMIQSGLDTSIYYASLTGFDTHVAQAGKHDRLLQEYSDAVYSFIHDLKKNGKLDNVLVMTFSEFGRRVSQNASGGTDHGTANNLYIMGSNLKKTGFYNKASDLSDLDNGDLKYQVDFRNIYATILKKHLNEDDKGILGKMFEYMNFI